MIQSIRQIKQRIRSIENTVKMTRAMEMISVAKLRPLQEKLSGTSDYFLRSRDILGRFFTQAQGSGSHFFKAVKDPEKIVLCLWTSDTGLCGSYNQNILRAVDNFISHHQGKYIRLITAGKKGFTYYKRQGSDILDAHTDSHGRYTKVFADEITAKLIALFEAGEADAVYMAYTRFDSPSRLSPVIDKFLNIEMTASSAVTYGAEPDFEAVTENLVTSYLMNKTRYAALNAFVSEHSSRGMAMGEATDNAKEILHKLILLKNKIRQANITRDIIEVISTSNALKG